MKRGRFLVYLFLFGFFLTVALLSAQTSSWATPDQSRVNQTVPTPTPESMAITLTVTLQRPNAPPPSSSWAVPVHLAFYPPGDPNTIRGEWDLTLNPSGQWSGGLNLAPGTYDVRARNLHTLRNVKRNVAVAEGATINMGTLHEGDATGDNTVNILDFARLRNSYFRSRGMSGFDATADFDENGTINILDFALLRGSYFMQGDIEVVSLMTSASENTSVPVTLTLVPGIWTTNVGGIAPFVIQVDATAQPLLGLDVVMTYRSDIVAITDATGQLVTSVVPGATLPVILQNAVDPIVGRLTFSAANFEGAKGGVINVAGFYIRGLQGGSAEARFQPQSVGVDENGREVPLVFRQPAIQVVQYRQYLPIIFKR